MTNEPSPNSETNERQASEDHPPCGIVMPISSIDGCSEQHWLEVRNIIEDAVGEAGFAPKLVSIADDIGIIQKRIIQNLYENPIVVCDVSAKNPNVMFELGMRLAFDKATVIVKDDKTGYSFDTSPIEHIGYRRDLRFSSTVEFKRELTRKIKATYERSTSDGEFSQFLKHFGQFKVPKLDTVEVSGNEMIYAELVEMRAAILSLANDLSRGQPLQGDNLVQRLGKIMEAVVRDKGLKTEKEIRNAKEEIREQTLLNLRVSDEFKNATELRNAFENAFTFMLL